MNDRVVIPIPGLGVLALDREQYLLALAEGAKLLMPREPVVGDTQNDALLDAKQLAAVLGVPVTWVAEAARRGRIPSRQFGRWRRFRRGEVEAAVRLRDKKP